MSSVVPKKTPRNRADWHLSNLVLEGGKSKRPDGTYVSRDEKGKFVAQSPEKGQRPPASNEVQ